MEQRDITVLEGKLGTLYDVVLKSERINSVGGSSFNETDRQTDN